MMKIFCIRLKDGREFKIACENQSQVNRFIQALKKHKVYPNNVTDINGIHSIKQFEQIIKTL